MIKLEEKQSREIRAELLERQFPHVKAQLQDGEAIRAVAQRKAHYVTGAFCIIIGVLFAMQLVMFFLKTKPLLAIVLLLLFSALIWIGVLLVIFIKKEYVFVTDRRIAHHRINLLGQLNEYPLSIPFSEINGIHLYKNKIMTRQAENGLGDILIKMKNKTYLVPTVMDGSGLTEILIAELKLYKGSMPGE